jgi:hypothetical protein
MSRHQGRAEGRRRASDHPTVDHADHWPDWTNAYVFELGARPAERRAVRHERRVLRAESEARP